MRGGEGDPSAKRQRIDDGTETGVEGAPSAKSQRMDDRTETVVDGSKPVVATPDSNSWFPDTSSLTGALGSATEGTSSFFSGAKEEGSGVISSATGALSGFFSGPVEEPKGSGTAEGSGTPGTPVETNGGKRRSKQMRMKGGRGLGLDYYATSVNGIKVAQPTYMEYYKGGKRRTKRSRRRTCKKRRRTCKRRRSCKR